MSATRASWLRRLAAWLGVLVLVGCATPATRSQQVSEGSPQLGAELIEDYGCVSCHNVPGINTTPAWVGPPLDHWGQRSYIAGSLNNNMENLMRWIIDPQGVEEGTAMPDLGVSEQDARNIAAFLLSME